MKGILLIFLLTVSSVGFSQPNTGIKIGSNYAWMKSDFNSLEQESLVGLDVGYAWRIKVNQKVSISLETIYSRFRLSLPEYDMYSQTSKFQNQSIYYITTPVGVNYMIARRYYASAGYQFGYNLYEFLSENITNEYMHAGYVGGGFHTRYFDVVARYVHDLNALNKPTSGIINEDGSVIYGNYLNRLRYLQLGIVVGLGGKSKRNLVE